jgi:hypothetical protein
MTDYYVSSSEGNDSNNGTSDSTPWATLDKVNRTTLVAGDNVYLKGGDTWYEMLIVDDEGSSESPITISTYGTGKANLLFDINTANNPSFETFTGTKDDGTTDTITSWSILNADATNIAEVVSDAYQGTTALKITRDTVGVYARQYKLIDSETEYTFSLFMKTTTTTGGSVTIKKDGENLWLQEDGTWAGTAPSLFTATSSTYTEKTKTFTTPYTESGQIQIIIYLYGGSNGQNAFYDAVWLGKGDTVNSLRSPTSENYNWTWNVLLSGSYINVSNLNVVGNALTDYSLRGTQGLANIEITGSNITVSDVVASYGGYGCKGIDATTAATNVTYDNVIAHNNGNTGIYNNSNGAVIKNCTSYHNGILEEDLYGDLGGIGLFSAVNPQVLNNIVYGTGRNNIETDFAISAVNVSGDVKIIGNYVHDVYCGAIQIVAPSQTSCLIAYNIVDGYGSSTSVPSFAGKYAGIRVGASSAAPNTKIYNNLIMNGAACSSDYMTTGILFYHVDTINCEMKNNIVMNVDSYATFTPSSLSPNHPVCANNCYHNNSLGWRWSSVTYTVYSNFATASGETDGMAADPLLTAPSAATPDYSLDTGSPCIEAGLAITGFNDTGGYDDFYGNPPRSIPNIGHDQYEDIGIPVPTNLAGTPGTTSILWTWQAGT